MIQGKRILDPVELQCTCVMPNGERMDWYWLVGKATVAEWSEVLLKCEEVLK